MVGFCHTLAAFHNARYLFESRRLLHVINVAKAILQLKAHEAVLLASFVINVISASACYCTFVDYGFNGVCADPWQVHTAAAQWGSITVTLPLMAYLVRNTQTHTCIHTLILETTA